MHTNKILVAWSCDGVVSVGACFNKCRGADGGIRKVATFPSPTAVPTERCVDGSNIYLCSAHVLVNKLEIKTMLMASFALAHLLKRNYEAKDGG